MVLCELDHGLMWIYAGLK